LDRRGSEDSLFEIKVDPVGKKLTKYKERRLNL